MVLARGVGVGGKGWGTRRVVVQQVQRFGAAS